MDLPILPHSLPLPPNELVQCRETFAKIVSSAWLYEKKDFCQRGYKYNQEPKRPDSESWKYTRGCLHSYLQPVGPQGEVP
jgi:hypothetical protein